MGQNNKNFIKSYDMLDEIKSRRPLFKWILLTILIGSFTYINLPFLMVMVLAAIFALGTHDAIHTLHLKLGVKFRNAVLLCITGGFILFLLPITLAIYRIVAMVSRPDSINSDQLITQINTLKDFILNHLNKVSEFTGMDLAGPAHTLFENSLKGVGGLILNFSSQFIAQLPELFIGTFIFTLLLGLFLIKGEVLKTNFLAFSPFSEKTSKKLVDVSKQSCSVTLFSTFVVGLVQAGVVGIGSLMTSEGDFWLVLTITFFVSFIPVIGAAPVGYFLAALAFVGGRTANGFVLVVIATIAGGIDNVLKPILVGRSNDVNPIIGFTCVVGAIIMMGLPGLLIGPVIMNLFVGIAPVLLEKEQIEVLETAPEMITK